MSAVERQPFDPSSPYWGEHIARYDFALRRLRGKRILDVACGTGYGLKILASAADLAVGVDLELAPSAREGASRPRISLTVARGEQLPFRDGAFDFVTSFETIEHLANRESFLDELRRVLSPSGTLILSTPNAQYTRPVDGKPRNPFHVHEYVPTELEETLKRRFSSVSILGQRLSEHFGISPFWDDQELLPKTVMVQMRLIGLRALHKLPSSLREYLSQQLLHHSFFPSASDYTFTDIIDEQSRVLLATCSK